MNQIVNAQNTAVALLNENELCAQFDQLVAAVEANVLDLLTKSGGHAFRVANGKKDGVSLFSIYLNTMEDPAIRQWHNCHCCASFIRRYGNLVVIDPDTGKTKSLLWNEDLVKPFYQRTVRALRMEVETRLVREVFFVEQWLGKSGTLGHVEKGGHQHFAISDSHFQQQRKANSAMGRCVFEYKTLSQHLHKLPADVVLKTEAIFTHDKDLRTRNGLPKIQKFLKLQGQVASARGLEARNLVWLAVSQNTGNGFYRFASSVEGQFIDSIAADYFIHTRKGNDIVGQVGFNDAKRQYLAATRPEAYMRPTEKATAQNIQQAEKIIAELGLASALRRRPLRLDEIPESAYYWRPQPAQESKGEGVFAHLIPKDQTAAQANLPVIDGGTMTMSRFMEEVAPKAKQIFFNFKPFTRCFFSVPTTQVVADAKPILVWDHEDRRNPVSTYCYSEPVSPSAFNLNSPKVELVGITKLANEYFAEKVDGNEVFLILKDARDMNPHVPLDLFPEVLRPELHAVRSTIEQFAANGRLEETENGFAGFSLAGGGFINSMFTVELEDCTVQYMIDRFN